MRILLAAAAGLVLAAGPAQAQAPAKPAAKAAAPVPQAQPQPGRVYYDTYQASQRQRLRRESCMKDEDLQGVYCVKKCRDQYAVMSGQQLPRMCRSLKPLPPGELPVANQVQKGVAPGPQPMPSKPVPGD